MRPLSNFEKLSLMLTASADPIVKKNYAIDPQFIAHIISSKHEWALSWKYQWLDKERHPLDNVVEEVCNIFDVYRHMQDSAKHIGFDVNRVVFPGFDGNNDPHYGVARTIVSHLEGYTDLSGALNNSHSRASIARYQAMIKVYNTMPDKPERSHLSIEELQKLLEA